jgi:hypothetical protein
MNYLLGQFKVDLKLWKQVVTSDTALHREAGMHFQRVWRNVDKPGEIFFLFRLEDVAVAKAFLEKTGALDKEKMKRGEIPHLTFLQETV